MNSCKMLDDSRFSRKSDETEIIDRPVLIEKYLSETQFFRDVDSKTRIEIFNQYDMRIEKRHKGNEMYTCCTPCDRITAVISGVVMGVQFDDAGNRSIVQIFRENDLIGLPLAAGYSTLYLNIYASEDSIVLSLPASALSDFAYAPAFPDACRRILWNVTDMQIQTSVAVKTRVSILSKRNTRDKILHYLKKEAQHCHSLELRIPFSRQELADYLFVERTALSHQLSKLKKEGYFDFSQNEFHLNPEHFSPE